MSKIKIHQALYGEMNKAHSKIQQTVDDSELTSFLIRFTDKPGSLAPGVKLKPYLSGTVFGDYYVFTKTFSDPHASRAGMVITHVLIAELKSLKEINDLQDILKLLMSEVPEVRDNLEPIEIIVGHSVHIDEKLLPVYVQKSLAFFIKGELPILFSGDLESFKAIIQKLWNSPISALREQLKYRSSFSPQDIVGSNDLTIVLIQSELLPKWKNSQIISGDEKDLIEITSNTEALFLGIKKENPLFNFLETLGTNLSDLNTYTKGDILYTDYINLDKLNDPDLLRRDLRILAKLSPKKNLGNTIKSKFLEKYSELVHNGSESNVKGLRNIPWECFNQAEENGKNLVNAIIDRAIRDSQFKHIEMLSEVSSIAVNETNKTWWHKATIDTFKLNISKTEEVVQNSIWKLLLFSKHSSKTILSIIPSSKDSESLLIKYLPKEIPSEIGNSILLELQKRKWYLLHAEILLKLYIPLEAIKKQLTLECLLNFDESIGVSMILKEIPDDGILSITLDSCNDKLIKELTKRTIKNESLLRSLELQVSCWLNIWSALLNENQAFNYGIRGKEQSIVFNVFDLALNGKKIDAIVFEKISNTTYSNISDYQSRQKVWQYIPISSKGKFIETTSESILQKLLNDEIDSTSIEQILIDRITSTEYMTSFLNTNRNNIEPVLKIFESFSSLPDKFLSDYIYYYHAQITEVQSKRLGALILNRNFSASARNVYDKSKYYISFTVAFEVCKSLVKLNWWESFLSSPTPQTKSQYYSMEHPKNIQTNPIEALPTVVILTAIKEEYLAVREHLVQRVDATQKSTTYEAGVFEFKDKLVAKVIIRECGPKNTNAAQETERAIQYFAPNLILFVGIAGSRKPQNFSIGDVIYPTMIYSYEAGRSGKKPLAQDRIWAEQRFT